MECFFCKLPLISDDFKNDRIEETRSFIAHKTCVDKALQRFWNLSLEDILGSAK